MFEGFCCKFPHAMLLTRIFLILSLVSMLAISDICGSRHQKLIWIGPISKNVSLRVISVVTKFHAFIINLNNFGR